MKKIMSVLIITGLVFIFFLSPERLCFAQKNDREFEQDLFSVSFPIEKEGWACGRWGTVIHSDNGGETWISQNSGTDYTLSSIYFVDANQGWAAGEMGTIIHTEDGGKTWTKQQSPVSCFLMKIKFTSPQEGWIVTERTTILHTKDGGKNWQIQFKDQDFILHGISFCDEHFGWAVGEYGYIYHTADGGTTWHKQAGSFRISDFDVSIEGGTYLFDVVALDSNTAWAVGIGGYIIRTSDGGMTWQEVVRKEVPKTHLFGIYGDEKGMLIMGGITTIIVSTDGGATIKSDVKIEPPLTYDWIYDIGPRGKTGFVALGKDGNIYLSDENAGYWQKAKMSQGQGLN